FYVIVNCAAAGQNLGTLLICQKPPSRRCIEVALSIGFASGDVVNGNAPDSRLFLEMPAGQGITINSRIVRVWDATPPRGEQRCPPPQPIFNPRNCQIQAEHHSEPATQARKGSDTSKKLRFWRSSDAGVLTKRFCLRSAKMFSLGPAQIPGMPRVGFTT